MYIVEGCPSLFRRMRRENGTWGVTVTLKYSAGKGKRRGEKVITNECGTFPVSEEIHMAEAVGSVGCSRGLTINCEDYNSARIDVWVTLPTKPEDASDTYDKCVAFVESRVEAEAGKVRDQIAKLKGATP